MEHIEVELRLSEYTNKQSVYLMAFRHVLDNKTFYKERDPKDCKNSIEMLFEELERIEGLMFEGIDSLWLVEQAKKKDK